MTHYIMWYRGALGTTMLSYDSKDRQNRTFMIRFRDSDAREKKDTQDPGLNPNERAAIVKIAESWVGNTEPK